MDKLCVLIDKRDGTRDLVYSDERPAPNFFIREWKYIRLSEEKIKEIDEATHRRVQDILKTL